MSLAKFFYFQIDIPEICDNRSRTRKSGNVLGHDLNEE